VRVAASAPLWASENVSDLKRTSRGPEHRLPLNWSVDDPGTIDRALDVDGSAGATCDVDIERVAFSPFAFGNPPPSCTPLHFDHTGEVAGGIEALSYEALSYNDRGELLVRAYVDHRQAVRCNAFSVSGDVLEYSLHDTDRPGFYARVEKIRLREVSLVQSPVQPGARASASCRRRPRCLRPAPLKTLT
jgi:hypothetical protein